MRRDLGHWTARGLSLDPEKAVGFVYLIIEKETNRKYVGKKHFKGRGKLNRGVASNWKSYCSSSKFLQELIKQKGKEAFHFFILEQYNTVGGLSWAETFTQTYLRIPEKNDEYFNRFIDKVTWKPSEKVTSKHERNLAYYLKKYPYGK